MQNQEYEALINSCDKESAVRFLRTVFGKEFGGKEEKTAEGISIIGSVTLSDTNGRPKPVLCCFKAMEKNLTERSSRRKQFDDSVKVLKQVFAKPYMGNGPVNGVFTQGLFFFCDGNGNFRLSLVTSEIANGKQELNNYRRQSFFVESKERNNTFRHRLCKRISNFFELKEAFNVEKLSDDFFKEYKVFYEDIVQYITGVRFVEEKKNQYVRKELSTPCSEIFDQFIDCYATTENAEKAVRNYVKKLMGRLVFVQFLQKKGWLGISVEKSGWNGGDLRFLQNLFANASEEEKDDFIDKVLEDVLFYAFNTKETERKFRNKLLKQYKFPFLNGGLFEMDGDDKLKFALPAEAFSNENSEIASTERRNPYNKSWAKKRKPYFNKDACGLFDFFDRYNFTIDENDPTDAEVSVDPEMLGKIFENLLEDNKDKGAFYTPKEIVNYMVNESLIAYLDHSGKDSAIRDFVLTQKTSDFDEKKKSLLNEKLNDIKICDPAIGSGAFPMGILNTLVKCRLALSDLPDEKNALANFKRHIIQNNIYGVDIEKGAVDIARLRFWLSLVVDEEKPEALPNLDFKIMQGNSLLECYEGIDLSSVASGEKKRGPVKSSSQVSLVFDEAEAMKQIQKDLRSYYRTQEHSEKNSLKKAINEGVKNYLKFIAPEKRKEIDAMEIPNDKFFLWHTYFYDVFKQGGFDIVIGNPPYIDSESMTKQGLEWERKILQKNYPNLSGNWDIYMAFFELSLNIGKNISFITPDKWLSKPFGETFRKNQMCKRLSLIAKAGNSVFDNATVDAIIALFKSNENRTTFAQFVKKDEVDVITCENISKIEKPYLIDYLFSNNIKLIKKIESVKFWTRNYVECENACATSDFYKVKDLIEKNASPNLKDYYKLINTGTIEKYHNKWSEKEITYGGKYPYPVVSKKKFNTLLGKSYTQRASLPKIIFKGLNLLDGCLDENASIIPGKSTLVLCSQNINLLKFLLGILNSKLPILYIKSKYASSSYCGGITFTKDMINDFPIPSLKDQQQQPIINLVDKILAAKQVNPQADTSGLESQIDALVYKLYDLSETEIEIIEKSSVKSEKDTENKKSVKRQIESKKKYLVTTDEEL